MSSFEIIAYPLLPIAAMELLLGFLLLRQSSRSSPAHRSVAIIAFFASAYALNTAVMYLMASRGGDFIPFARLNWIGWFTLPAALQFLFYLRSERSRAARRAGWVLYPYWTAVLALCLFTDLIVTPGYSLIPYRNDPGPLEVPARFIGAAILVWLIVEILRTRRLLTGVKRFQLDHFFYGAIIFAAGAAAIAGILPAVGGTGVEPGLGSYFGLPWVALTFYAMVRHSLFDMRATVSRTLAIAIVILLLAALQAGLLTALRPVFGTALSSFISLSVLGFFLFGTPISREVQTLVNRVVIGDRYDHGTLMREAIVALNAKEEERVLIDRLFDAAADGPGISDAGIFLHRVEDGYLLRQGRGRFAGMQGRRALADLAVERLRETGRPLVLAALPAADRDPGTVAVRNYLLGIQADALVPLRFQEKLLGALALGKKAGGGAYRQSDVSFLETLAAHAASALENARLAELERTIRSAQQESDERFLLLARDLPAAVIIHRRTGIVYANAAAEQLTGYGQEDLRAMQMDALIHPSFRDGPEQGGPARELRVFRKDGNERWAAMTSSVIAFGDESAVLEVLFDLTGQKRAEGRMRYERIRDAVAAMASRLSRDLEWMVRDLRDATAEEQGSDRGGPGLPQRARSAVEQADVLIRTLQEFSGRAQPKRTLQDLNELVSGRKQVLASLLTATHELVLRPAAGPLPVLVDTIRIERALMNLVAHARDVMPQGGAVAVAVDQGAIDASFIQRMGYGTVGSYALVSVSDSGEGMKPAEQERVFEPFFAGTGDWKGSAMGLPLVYDIAKEHEGYITVASAPGRGSTFTLYLPLAA